MCKNKIKYERPTVKSIYVRFISALNKRPINPLVNIPMDTTNSQLSSSFNKLVKNEENSSYLFYIWGLLFSASSIKDHLNIHSLPTSSIIDIIYVKQTFISSNPIRLCSAEMIGHSESVLTILFSPDGQKLCSGSGDTTIRFWNLTTSMPEKIGKSYHRSWILCLSWSPDGIFVASGGLDGLIGVWRATTKELEASLIGHKDWVACLSWEPCHLEFPCRRLLSGSKDGSIRIWDTRTKKSKLKIFGHTKTVKSVRWGGDGRIFSGSADGTIKVWSSDDGQLIHILNAHRNWVNMICLSTDYVLRCGIFGLTKPSNLSEESSLNTRAKVSQRYQEIIGNQPVRLASGSDDFTLSLWYLTSYDTPRARMVGHQKPISYLSFSPNGKWLISASFDNSIRLWCGMSGRFLSVFNGHKGSVYMCAWSPASRFFVSVSKDRTIKVWDVEKTSLKESLEGHTEHVFAVDWSPDGYFVASGGRDSIIKLWKH